MFFSNKKKGAAPGPGVSALLLFFTLCTANLAQANFANFTVFYPRFTMKQVDLQNSGNAAGAASSLAAANGISLLGTNTSLFMATSGGKITWQDSPTATAQTVLSPSATIWAEIDPTTNTVLQGRIDIFGNLLNFNGLQFGADLSRVRFAPDKIGFGQINHSGNVCTQGFCSFAEELLLFKNLQNFNGDFSAAFTVNGVKAISEVPLPAAAWLLASGWLGLLGLGRRKLA